MRRVEQFPTEAHRQGRARQLLTSWREEARRRAAILNGPSVWELATNPGVQAMAQMVDPSGELLNELRRICAEAVEKAAGKRLV